MQTHYGSWVPDKVLGALATAAVGLTGTALVTFSRRHTAGNRWAGLLPVVTTIGAAGATGLTALAAYARHCFDLDRPGSMAQRMINGTAAMVDVDDGGTIVDIGCGSGALTIACAKRNPTATVIGIDRWKLPYDYYSQDLCYSNAAAEGVTNVQFIAGDARWLPFRDASVDAVVSNYVYHNVPGTNRHKELGEALRIVQPGGSFAIHDVFSPIWFGNIRQFMASLQRQGYDEVDLVPTGDGRFIKPWEKRLFALYGTAVLHGVK